MAASSHDLGGALGCRGIGPMGSVSGPQGQLAVAYPLHSDRTPLLGTSPCYPVLSCYMPSGLSPELISEELDHLRAQTLSPIPNQGSSSPVA